MGESSRQAGLDPDKVPDRDSSWESKEGQVGRSIPCNWIQGLIAAPAQGGTGWEERLRTIDSAARRRPGLLTISQIYEPEKRWESADKPGSVEGNHPSGTRVAARLKRPTRKPPRAAGADPATRTLPYLALLQVGFAVPPNVATGAVRSYRTLSPLPAGLRRHRRFAFCCTFRGLAPPRRYLAPCSVEPGLSSTKSRSGCLADSRAKYSARGLRPTVIRRATAQAPGRRAPCAGGR